MSDLADLYPGFASRWIDTAASRWIDTAAGRIFARTGGEGPPLLLLILIMGFPRGDDGADLAEIERALLLG